MSDFIVSLIRTWTPTAIGALLAWLQVRGMDINPNDVAAVTTGLTGLFIAGYYLLARLVERRWPQLGFLLGSAKKPEYREV